MMFCTVVAEFLLTSASRGPSAISEPLVFQEGGHPPSWICLGQSMESTGPYRCTKLGSFDNMKLSIFGVLGWKMPIHAPKIGLWGYLTLNG